MTTTILLITITMTLRTQIEIVTVINTKILTATTKLMKTPLIITSLIPLLTKILSRN